MVRVIAEAMTILMCWFFFYLGWVAQLWRENGLSQTRRELRAAYREYDELLTLLHHSPVVEEQGDGAPAVPVERRRLTIVRGDSA